MAQHAVIGLGQLGRAVALSLTAQGESVLAIDLDEHVVQDLAPEVDQAVRADTTDEDALAELGILSMDSVVVAIGAESLEASILTCALLRQAGVPRVIARASNALHARVLRAVGAHEVFNAEEEMGARLAERLLRPTIREQVAFGETRLAEVQAPEQLTGKRLEELHLRRRHGVSVVAIHRGDTWLPNPDAQARIEPGDVLLVLGDGAAIDSLSRLV